MIGDAEQGPGQGGGWGGGAGNGGQGNGGNGGGQARSRRVLAGISSRSWEHPADRAALAALRRIPIFDQVLRTLFGFFGEKPVRLAFQANAIRVSDRQYARIHHLYADVLRTMDAPEHYPLYVSQTPVVNAGAYGMEKPFIILNSGTVNLLDDDELSFVMGHEVGHIMSGHVLYRTMTVILLQLASLGFPLVGLAARAVLMALLEWSRKSELSCDRAGLLSVQDPDVALRTMMKTAGGGTPDAPDLGEFVRQDEEYREGGDVADSVFKVLNLLGMTHPFFVLRVSELRAWIESGDYDRILRGEYTRQGDPDPDVAEDLQAAMSSYVTEAKSLVDEMATAARRMGEQFRGGLGF
jgi:Zn-dependent protease with chaperone function